MSIRSMTMVSGLPVARRHFGEDRERKVLAYIHGEAEVPEDLQLLVRKYQEYAVSRGELISYPRAEDERANRIYDALIAMAR